MEKVKASIYGYSIEDIDSWEGMEGLTYSADIYYNNKKKQTSLSATTSDV